VLPRESRRHRPGRRAGRKLGLVSLERLEGRELLAYTPLGFSLPDLTVSGYTSNTAAWGGQLTVTLNVRNLGASTFPEPTALQPNATSHADSPPTTVAVILSRGPHLTSHNSFVVGYINVPAVTQNSLIQKSMAIPLPPQPAGFPGDGGKVFVSFRINPFYNVNESDFTNNLSTSKVPVLIEAPLPELAVTAVNYPPVMQPLDTIQAEANITNFGPAATGPVTVALVASVNRKFTSGSTRMATVQIPSIAGASSVSSGIVLTDNENLVPQQNTVQVTFPRVTLPPTPHLFIGVVIDPDHKITQITPPSQNLSMPQQVGEPIKNLPPAGGVYPAGQTNLPFPYPPNVTSVTPPNTPQTGVTP
jgi:hypothetical protein